MLGNACCALHAIAGNIKASTDTAPMKVGQTIEIRFVGTNNTFVHPMPVQDVVSVAPQSRLALQCAVFCRAELFVNLERSRREIVRLWLRASAPTLRCHRPACLPVKTLA